MIRGKKNFLPPTQLVYGFAVLFRVEDACIEKHADERKPLSFAQSNESVDSESVSHATASENVLLLTCVLSRWRLPRVMN
jgi:hypothetical protein